MFLKASLTLSAFLLLTAAPTFAAPHVYYNGDAGHKKDAQYRNGRCYRITWKVGSTRKSGWLIALEGSQWRVWPDGAPGETYVPKWLVVEVKQVHGTGCLW